MAAAIDGTILIDSHIITDGLNSDIAAVEDRLRQVAKRTRRAGGHAAAAATGNAEYDEVVQQLAAAEKEADRLSKKFNELVDKEERFIATGGDVDSKTFKGYEYDIEKTTQAMAENDATIAGLRDRLAELDQSALQTANAENQGATAAEQLSDAVHGVADASSHAAATTTGLGKGTTTTASGFKGLLRTILKYGLGIRSVYILFRKLRQAIIEGFKNLAQVDNQTNESISTLKSSLSQLKNSFAAAFAPVLNAVAPILNKLIRMLVTAANYVGMFFAALSGASSYRPAIYAYEDYADSLNNAAGAAADAAKNLSGLDEMNVWQENSGGGGGGGTSPADMFGDEEAIPNSVANIAEKVKSIFMAVYNAVAPVLKDLWNLLVFEADDVLFNWDNLSSEDILEKIVAGLGLLLGAIVGFKITHSLKGIIIGAVVGLAITLLLDGVVFDDDGKISAKEIMKLLVGVLAGAAGAAIGFSVTHTIKGAAIGAVIGMLLTVLIQRIEFSSDPVKNTNIKNLLQSALITLSGGYLGFQVGGGIGAVVGVAVGLAISALAWETTDIYALTEAQQQLVDSVNAITDAYKATSEEMEKNTAIINRNYDRVGDLWNELQTLCDANGNVVDGYENRVDVILGELNSALDTEYSRNGDIISQYQEMQREIDNLIAKKRAEALFSNWDTKYAAALGGIEEFRSGDSQQKYRDALALRDEKQDAFIAAVNATATGSAAGTDVYGDWVAYTLANGGTVEEAMQSMVNVFGHGEGISRIVDAYNAYLEADAAVKGFEETTRGYYETVDRYEKAQAAMLAGDYETATRILSSYSAFRWREMEKGHRYTQQELADLRDDLDTAAWYAAWYKQQFEAGMEGFTKDGLDEASSAAAELAEIWHDAGADAKEYAAFYKQQFEMGMAGYTAKGLFEAKVAAGELEKTWTDAAGEAEAYAAWYKECFENGLAGFTKEGLAEAEQFATDMHTTLDTAAETAETDGENIALGLAEGIKGKAQEAIKAAKKLAQDVLDPLKNIPQIASPAKVTRGYGRFISLGYALGITDEIGAAENAATRVANSALAGMMTTFSGAKLPFSRIASGGTIPTAAALSIASNQSSFGSAGLEGVLRNVLSEFMKSKTYSVSAKANQKNDIRNRY